MLKITQIKVPKYTLVLRKHLSKFAIHNKDLNHEQHKKSTELSKYIWLLKEDQIMSRIRWSINEIYGRTKINFSPICLAENLHYIEHFNGNRLLNKRNEFISGCRYEVKFLLKGSERK